MRLDFPLDPAFLLRKKNALKRELLSRSPGTRKRIAVLGGSTTAEVVDQLEIFLLLQGIQPEFYQSEYNKYYEDALFPGDALKNFKPDLVYLHTTTQNIREFPRISDSPEQVDMRLHDQLQHFEAIWHAIENQFGCVIVQNNFEEPWQRPLGNLDAVDYRGRSRFVGRLNEGFAQAAARHKNLHVHDIHYLAARFGIDRWFSPRHWYLYKYAMDMEMIPHLAHHLAAVISAIWGRSRKCLVLDLDNTLWGGVIGDDGVDGIQIGQESPEAEAFTDLQRYARSLKERGIILAVCSKNDETNALLGFSHSGSVLAPADFSAFRANWEPKSSNIERIASDLNIGIDSLVFVDDNPAERDIVRAQIPAVTVPEIGTDVTDYLRVLDQSALFETVSLSEEDLSRSRQYSENTQRQEQQARFASYDEFLASLEMSAEIRPFNDTYFERIAQLINKTNQFNLTTLRCTEAEVQIMANSSSWITLYGKLRDKFGDNGLISVVAGEISGSELHIRLWLMSCRVLKRGMENAMMEELCTLAAKYNVKKLIGYYIPTAKNNMVKDFYEAFGFVNAGNTETQSVWTFDLARGRPATGHFIEVSHEQR